MLLDLKDKFNDMRKQAQEEQYKNEMELRSMVPKLDEVKMLRGEQHINVEDVKLGHEDKLIVQLRQALNRPTTTPDDICNILTTDIHEKERLQLKQLEKERPQLYEHL